MNLPHLHSLIGSLHQKAQKWALGSDYIAREFRNKQKVRLTIGVPSIALFRGQTIADDVVDLYEPDDDVQDLCFDVSDLIRMVYLDFLEYIKRGVPIEKTRLYVEELIQKYQNHGYLELHEERPNYYKRVQVMDRIVPKRQTEEVIELKIRFTRKDILRGEMILYELNQLNPDLQVSIETFISLNFQDFIDSSKEKSNESLIKTISSKL